MLTLPAASADPGAAGSTSRRRTDASLIYFSSVSDNTHRFVRKLGIEAARIPLFGYEPQLEATAPYVLVVPTYGGGDNKGAVPRQVIKFLNDPANRSLIRGVISAGNTNFGEAYCLAGDVVSAKCQVPHLYRFELMGTSEDVDRVSQGLEEFWIRQSQK